MKFILFLVSVVCVAPLAQIQAQDGESHKRIPVFFSCNCADEVGKLYATALRDLLAKSPRYIESASPDLTGGAVDGPPKLSIVVTSIDPTGTADSWLILRLVFSELPLIYIQLSDGARRLRRTIARPRRLLPSTTKYTGYWTLEQKINRPSSGVGSTASSGFGYRGSESMTLHERLTRAAPTL